MHTLLGWSRMKSKVIFHVFQDGLSGIMHLMHQIMNRRKHG